MKKISIIMIFLSIFFFGGCANLLDQLAKDMQAMQNKNALAGTEDTIMVKTFIKKLPKSTVSRNQLYISKKLDLGGKAFSQSTNLNSWIYRPKEFFERNSDKNTPAFDLWTSVVKQRGGVIKKYNAKVTNKLGEFIYLNRLQSYEQYYFSLTPSYIEYNTNGDMISAFIKVLKTEDLSAVGGYVVEGHHSYNATEYDIVLMRTNLRKLQMNTSKRFFEDNFLDLITK